MLTEGQQPYTPTRVQWLAVETNQNTDECTQNVAFLQREVARLESELEQLKSAKRNSKHTPINS